MGDPLRQELDQLPRGYISRKVIKGKIYFYHQWSENGKKKSKYLNPQQAADLETQIARRRVLEQTLRAAPGPAPKPSGMFYLTGEALRDAVRGVAGMKRRACLEQLEAYLFSPEYDRICVLFGLRGTGKSTLMRQALYRMRPQYFQQAVYIYVRQQDTSQALQWEMNRLFRKGYRYFFLDEITRIDDFFENVPVLFDPLIAAGVKIVLTGGDSLCFTLAQGSGLYDRMLLIHTTFLSYREHCRVLEEIPLEQYLHRGGFLRSDSPALLEGAKDYVDAALCRNISDSLERYEDGIHLRLLEQLHQADALDWAIRRSLERFCLEQVPPSQEFLEFMSLRELEDWSGGLNKGQLAQIKEYLKALDVIAPRNVEFIGRPKEESLCFTQPGLLWSLACSLLEEPEVLEQRLLADTLLTEAKLALESRCDVFRLQFEEAAFDMVIRVRKEKCCAVYAVSTQRENPDSSILTDAQLLTRAAQRFGPVVGKCLLYPGPTMPGPSGIVYQNAQEFLMGL